MIICLSGKKRSGKDTMAKLLAEHFGGKVERLAFADNLKVEVAAATGCTLDFIEQNKSAFRLILQGWGTDFRRNICGEDYWVKILRQRIENLQRSPNPPDLIVLTDCRFVNEAEMAKQLGGLVIRIERISHNHNDAHVSENAMDNYKFDYTFAASNVDGLRSHAKTLAGIIATKAFKKK